MTDFNRECLNALFDKEKFDKFMRTQLEEGLNLLLESELTAFLGYNPYDRNGWNSGNSRNGSYFRQIKTQFGPIKVQVPRDRNGEFHQQTLPAYGQHTDALESTVIQLYSHGVTTREISELIEKMYGSYYSAGTVSNISKQVASQVESYHQRRLSDKFFCVYLDATYIPLRRDTYQREAVYIAVGIKPNGNKEIIDYRIAPVENLEVWSEMIADFKERGLEQVELFLSDGFVGIKDMLKQYYPKSKFQRCLIHIMRNISQKVRVTDRAEILNAFKQVHKQTNQKEAETVLHAFYEAYGSKYSRMIKDLRKLEEDMLVFYQYPKQIRPSIYSTNMIESINRMIKRKTNPKSEFPSEESLDNFLGSQVIDYNDRNANRVHKGFGQVADTLESYFD
ncbi:IS256 family transposase [Lactobacillus johnsonii]|jgi:transposase-like protein|nr:MULTISPECIES: IS256 family transposase [Lactobacillus]MDB6231060.1 IS256 family transposase [Lactobacillus amylovorus]WNW28199.1 IS256 family transposase [Lactobacillus johnsonii]WNW28635.1 IS256 family transposase [Lactobacillus johnsonii]WNW29483.1 IS256 family transposase [Lactobacillus johnsonii]